MPSLIYSFARQESCFHVRRRPGAIRQTTICLTRYGEPGLATRYAALIVRQRELIVWQRGLAICTETAMFYDRVLAVRAFFCYTFKISALMSPNSI